MAIGNILGGLFTKPEKVSKFERYTPQQEAILNLLLQTLTGEGPKEGLLGGLLSEEKFAKPAIRQFEEKTIPGLAERFAGLGAGAQSSSAFQQALGQAGADLSERLAAMSAQQRQGLFGPLLGAAMQPRHEQVFQPSGPTGLASGIGGILGALGQGVGTGLGGFLGGLL